MQFTGPVTIFIPDAQTGIPEITGSPDRILKGEAVQVSYFVSKMIMLLLRTVAAAEQRIAVHILHPFSVIHMTQQVFTGNSHQIGGVRRADAEYFLFFTDSDPHKNTSVFISYSVLLFYPLYFILLERKAVSVSFYCHYVAWQKNGSV